MLIVLILLINVYQAVFLTGGQAFFGELQAQGVRRGQELHEPASRMPIPKSAITTRDAAALPIGIALAVRQSAWRA